MSGCGRCVASGWEKKSPARRRALNPSATNMSGRPLHQCMTTNLSSNFEYIVIDWSININWPLSSIYSKLCFSLISPASKLYHLVLRWLVNLQFWPISHFWLEAQQRSQRFSKSANTTEPSFRRCNLMAAAFDLPKMFGSCDNDPQRTAVSLILQTLAVSELVGLSYPLWKTPWKAEHGNVALHPFCFGSGRSKPRTSPACFCV